MKLISKYIFENQALREFDEKTYNNMICEAFKSSLLTKLAKKIDDARKSTNDSTFTSIFGPRTQWSKYGHKKSEEKLLGIKWSEITDDDFVKYDGYSKELKKLMTQVYQKKAKADFIVCDGDDIVYFINGFQLEDQKAQLFSFDGYNGKVKVETRKAYSYRDRPLKIDEVLVLIHDYDVYALTITDDMTKEYKDLNLGRIESRKGIINYDKKSLEELAKQQRNRYQTLAKEMRTNKLDDDKLFQDIKDANKEAMDIHEEVMKAYDNIDAYFDLSRVMSYVGLAYDKYYYYFREKKKLEKYKKHWEEDGKTKEEIERRSEYYQDQLSEYANDTMEYIKKVRNAIKEIKEIIKKGTSE